MRIDMKQLGNLLETLAQGDVSRFFYEDAKIKMKIIRCKCASVAGCGCEGHATKSAGGRKPRADKLRAVKRP